MNFIDRNRWLRRMGEIEFVLSRATIDTPNQKGTTMAVDPGFNPAYSPALVKLTEGANPRSFGKPLFLTAQGTGGKSRMAQLHNTRARVNEHDASMTKLLSLRRKLLNVVEQSMLSGEVIEADELMELVREST